MEDSISRQAAIDLIMETDPEWCIGMTRAIYEGIKKLPSAQSERKKGKWIDKPLYKQTMDRKTWDGYTFCSECKEMMHKYGYRSKFCPDCGADMRGEENETN